MNAICGILRTLLLAGLFSFTFSSFLPHASDPTIIVTGANIPATAIRTVVDSEILSFLNSSGLQLGSKDPHWDERRQHGILSVFNKTSIASIENTTISGPHGSIPIRIFYPKEKMLAGTLGALVYMHGGGYTVGSVDEFDNALRIIANEAGVIVIAVEYRLAPEYRYPTQLDEYEAVVEWARSPSGGTRGIDPSLVAGGGDSAGGNLSAALALRLRDQGKINLVHQFLIYPEARIPFDTLACTENNAGYYLLCNGIFQFARNYLPDGVPPSTLYVSPSANPVSKLSNLPSATVITCGFDPLRDVGHEYAQKLTEAGNKVTYIHHPDMTHGFIQFTHASSNALKYTTQLGKQLGKALYGFTHTVGHTEL